MTGRERGEGGGPRAEGLSGEVGVDRSNLGRRSGCSKGLSAAFERGEGAVCGGCMEWVEWEEKWEKLKELCLLDGCSTMRLAPDPKPTRRSSFCCLPPPPTLLLPLLLLLLRLVLLLVCEQWSWCLSELR